MSGDWARDALDEVLEAWFLLRERGSVPDLDELCGGDQELARRARSLLERYDEPVEREHLPERIAGYTVERLIGEGGMGTVYLARSSDALRRSVAVKVVKRGLDTQRVLRRFETEREALARMDHTGIARVFGAGETDRGRPFFVMEYVDGVALDRYCDARAMGVRQRLRLFQQVCAAVQHAHGKGVVHRDLKPGNILVTEVDGEPVAKVIDFGLARALDRDTTQTLFTRAGELVGTWRYMSPEQAGVGDLDVDARADVYSLGVVLYELLVGELPFPSTELRSLGALAAQRLIAEAEPPRPSVRLLSLGAEADRAATQRDTTAASLARDLRGDLDWIVLRGLAKERERRYQTPLELLADIERYLRDEPVLATPPSRSYRLRKFLRRYRLQVAAAALAIVGLMAGLVGVTWGLVEARSELVTRRQVSSFIVTLLDQSGPGYWGSDAQITLREVLDRGVRNLEGLPDHPVVAVQLLTTLGRLYEGLGATDEAEPLLRRAVEMARGRLDSDEPVSVVALAELANLYARSSRLEEAEPLYTEALARGAEALVEDHPYIALARTGLAHVYRNTGRFEQAEKQFEQVIALSRSRGDDEGVHMAQADLADVYSFQGRHADGERLLLSVLSELDGEDATRTVAAQSARHRLAVIYLETDRHAEAEPLLEFALEEMTRLFGRGHQQTLPVLLSLAHARFGLGRFDDARSLAEDAVSSLREPSGDRQQLFEALFCLAQVHAEQGRPDEQMRLMAECLSTGRAVAGWHPMVLETARDLAHLYLEAGRLDEAEALVREVAAGASAPWTEGALRAIARKRGRAGK